MDSEHLDGRFTVKGPLRCAGVGSLICAEDKTDGARTAIRVIPELAQGKEAVAAALRLPLHPVLPRALGSGAADGSSWVALDFPEGELLTHRIPQATPALLTMGASIAGALAALHQTKTIHGELSGDSVLVVPGAQADRFVLFDAPLVVMNRLSDRRGEERLLSQLTHLVPFLSPERARGADATEASDIWALGMVISLASGAKAIPGESTLEKIAAIVTNKWRPAVSGALPIALRLLLTRMLAPEPRDRPSSKEAANELEHLSVALNAQQVVKAHVPPATVTDRVPQPQLDALVEKMQAVDPFEALVAGGVTVNGPDAHAEPTRKMGLVMLTEQPAVAAMPTAPYGPAWNAPAAVGAPIPLLIPAHPSQQRRAALPLPPILDPAAVVVAPQPLRHPSPPPMARIVSEPVQSEENGSTGKYGALPGANRPAPTAAAVTEDVADEAAAARALTTLPTAMFANEPSPHDIAEDLFTVQVQRTRKQRSIAAAIAAGVIILVGGGVLLRSALEPEPETAKPLSARKVAAMAHEPEVAKVEPVAVPEPVAVKPEPVAVKPEPVAAKPEPVAAKPEPVAAKPAPAPKPAPVAKAEPVAKPTPAARAKKVEEAPRRPASRLDEGD